MTPSAMNAIFCVEDQVVRRMIRWVLAMDAAITFTSFPFSPDASSSRRHSGGIAPAANAASISPSTTLLLLVVLILPRPNRRWINAPFCPYSFHCELLCFVRSMSIAKRYVLRLFISLKYVTANVVDRQSGRVVLTASSVEKPLRDGLECGRTCNAKAAAAVGEVLAMRLKVDGLAREPIHADATKEVEKKGFKNRTKVWAILNALREHGVNLRLDDDGDHRPHV
uniref:Uncharacterized protein n=2 Tax=Oryza TaxID=4527 RepID=A0A0D3H9R4_9ORYZ